MAIPQPHRTDRLEWRETTRIARRDGPAYQAYQALLFGFTVAPIIAGLDKFFHFLVDWDQYLAPVVSRILGGIAPHTFMRAVGVVEIVAGIVVALKPSIGGWVVA